MGQTFAVRRVYAGAASDNLRGRAASAGFLRAVLGSMQDSAPQYGMLLASALWQGKLVRCVSCVASSLRWPGAVAKGGAQEHYLPRPGSLLLPLQAGQEWQIQLLADPGLGQIPQLSVDWLPQQPLLPVLPPAPGAGLSHLQQTARDLAGFHHVVSSGQLRQSVLNTAQATIDSRVADLTRILGDATGMRPDQEQRARFIADLQKIVCRAHLPGQSTYQALRTEDLQALLATFGQVTEHDFNPDQQNLLAAGVRALVEINANEENRNDLVLIQRNIMLFLDNVQLVLQRQFSSGQRRLLMRALVRLVGDGRHGGQHA